MKNLFFLSLVLVFLFSSCNNKQHVKSDKKNSTTNTNTTTIERVPDSLLFIGIWQRSNKKLWMEFKSNGVFNYGRQNTIIDSNRHWHIDTAKNAVYIDFSKGAKYIKYTVNNRTLQLNIEERGKIIELLRIGVRPDKQ